MEILDIIQNYGVNISIIFIGFGAMMLYFGKIIGDTKVESYDKLSYYVEGLYFSALYLFVPFLLSMFIKSQIGIILSHFQIIIMYFSQIIILSLITWNFKAHYYLRKYGLLDKYKKLLENKFEKIKMQESFTGHLIRNREDWFKKKFGIDYVELNILFWYRVPIKIFGNNIILFLFSFWIILTNLYIFEYFDVFLFGISAIFLFFILTLIAASYGFSNAYYPLAKIHLIDGKVFEGKILKFGDFVYLLKDDMKIFINRDKIKYLEEDLFKKEETHEMESAQIEKGTRPE